MESHSTLHAGGGAVARAELRDGSQVTAASVAAAEWLVEPGSLHVELEGMSPSLTGPATLGTDSEEPLALEAEPGSTWLLFASLASGWDAGTAGTAAGPAHLGAGYVELATGVADSSGSASIPAELFPSPGVAHHVRFQALVLAPGADGPRWTNVVAAGALR